MITARDAQRLTGVHPKLVDAIEDVFAQMEANGTPMFVVSGVRSAEEQAALYAQGRTEPGAIVTYKDGVTHRSDHQVEADGFGHAVDCAFVPGKRCSDCFHPSWPWTRYGHYVEEAEMVWGGHFKQPIDLDHAQYVAER